MLEVVTRDYGASHRNGFEVDIYHLSVGGFDEESRYREKCSVSVVGFDVKRHLIRKSCGRILLYFAFCCI